MRIIKQLLFMLLMMAAISFHSIAGADDVDDIAATCAAVTGLVASQIKNNSAELKFAEAKWWLKYTTTALVNEARAELQIAAREDFAAVWPVVIELDTACAEMKADVIAEITAN